MSNWHQFFRYDEASGVLTWVTGRNNGQAAGTLKRYVNGGKHCILIHLKNGQKPAHRIIWEMHHGPIPKGLVIDHINGDPFDNRLSNLRVCTRGENNRNHSTRSDNLARIKGIQKRGNSWRASIQVNKVAIRLGTFPTKGLAAVARAKAALRYHGRFASFR